MRPETPVGRDESRDPHPVLDPVIRGTSRLQPEVRDLARAVDITGGQGALGHQETDVVTARFETVGGPEQDHRARGGGIGCTGEQGVDQTGILDPRFRSVQRVVGGQFTRTQTHRYRRPAELIESPVPDDRAQRIACGRDEDVRSEQQTATPRPVECLDRCLERDVERLGEALRVQRRPQRREGQDGQCRRVEASEQTMVTVACHTLDDHQFVHALAGHRSRHFLPDGEQRRDDDVACTATASSDQRRGGRRERETGPSRMNEDVRRVHRAEFEDRAVAASDVEHRAKSRVGFPWFGCGDQSDGSGVDHRRRPRDEVTRPVVEVVGQHHRRTGRVTSGRHADADRDVEFAQPLVHDVQQTAASASRDADDDRTDREPRARTVEDVVDPRRQRVPAITDRRGGRRGHPPRVSRRHG